MEIGLPPNEDAKDDIAFLTQTSRFAGQAKATAYGHGRLLSRIVVERGKRLRDWCDAYQLQLAPNPLRGLSIADFCLVLGPIRRLLTNAESVQHHSPGQAHVSTTNVSAALGNGAVQWVGRAGDS